jgi:hypothetical protein
VNKDFFSTRLVTMKDKVAQTVSATAAVALTAAIALMDLCHFFACCFSRSLRCRSRAWTPPTLPPPPPLLHSPMSDTLVTTVTAKDNPNLTKKVSVIVFRARRLFVARCVCPPLPTLSSACPANTASFMEAVATAVAPVGSLAEFVPEMK